MAFIQMFTIVFMTIAFTVSVTAGLEEVCQWETFEAKCQQDEVIMIKEAHYGRMATGRCMPKSNGIIGCSADVSDIMHARCSGRQQCSVPVPDPAMFASTPCPKDLISYLQTDYECIKVAKHNTDSCDDKILIDMKGDIAKPKDGEKSQCPHRILAQPGQKVNIYLYDFYNKDANTKTKPECITYGYMSEGGKAPTKICGGEFRKNHLIYSSDSNVIDIMLTDASSHSHHYILHYEIVGCPTLHAPKNGWVKINDETAVVMCNFSHIASELVCSGNKWVGHIEKCTNKSTDFLSSDEVNGPSFIDLFINSGAFTIVCVGISSGILLGLGIVLIIKARQLKSQKLTEMRASYHSDAPISPSNNKTFRPVDRNQSVYVPISMDNSSFYAADLQRSLYEAPPGGVSHPHLMVTDYASSIDSCIPITAQNTYGSQRSDQKVPVYHCGQNIYELAALSHTLGREKIVSIEDEII